MSLTCIHDLHNPEAPIRLVGALASVVGRAIRTDAEILAYQGQQVPEVGGRNLVRDHSAERDVIACDERLVPPPAIPLVEPFVFLDAPVDHRVEPDLFYVGLMVPVGFCRQPQQLRPPRLHKDDIAVAVVVMSQH